MLCQLLFVLAKPHLNFLGEELGPNIESVKFEYAVKTQSRSGE